jgi:hypothetical protein
MKNRHLAKIFLFGVILFLAACGKLPDNFQFFDQVNLPDGINYKVLMCKLGCKNDPIINNVYSVEWNEKNMYVVQHINKNENYFLIKARGEKLSCCNNDSLLGPFSMIEFKVVLKKLHLPENLPNKRNY